MAARSVVAAITVPTLILWVLVGVSVVCAGQQASHAQPEGSHGCLGVENEAATCTQLLASGEADDGEQLARRILNVAPRCPDAWQCVGAAHYARGELVGASDAFARVR